MKRPTIESERIALLLKRERQLLSSLAEQPRKMWFRPMDVGGKDASWHSPTLNRLVKKGLVEKRLRGSLMNMIGGGRGSYEYRATIAGRRQAVHWSKA